MKKRVCSAILLIALISTAIFFMNENKTYGDEKDYLRKNNEIINLQEIDDFSGLNLLKKDLKNKKIIFTGEEHAVDKDNLFEIKMLKYLHDEIGVNYYLGEFSSTDAYFINKYLETGDETILKKSFDFNKGTPGNNIDDYNFFKQIYEFNKTIPDESRVRVVGIDIEHSGISSHDYILDIIKNRQNATKELTNLLEYLKIRDLKSIETTNKKLMKDVAKNEELYIELFGDKIEDFKHVLNNIQAMCVSYSSSQSDWDNIRDKYIYENFKYMDSKLKNAKYFGQWGGAHIYQETTNLFGKDTNFIASRLNKDENYKGKILSIQYGYYTAGKRNNSCSIDTNLFNEYLKTKDDAMLFKLNSENSPFNEEVIFPMKHKPFLKDGMATTDYFEYLLMIKGSEESKPIN